MENIKFVSHLEILKEKGIVQKWQSLCWIFLIFQGEIFFYTLLNILWKSFQIPSFTNSSFKTKHIKMLLRSIIPPNTFHDYNLFIFCTEKRGQKIKSNEKRHERKLGRKVLFGNTHIDLPGFVRFFGGLTFTWK